MSAGVSLNLGVSSPPQDNGFGENAAVEGGEPETQDSCRLQADPAPSDLTARTAGESALRLN